jgi:hypothetical protein
MPGSQTVVAALEARFVDTVQQRASRTPSCTVTPSTPNRWPSRPLAQRARAAEPPLPSPHFGRGLLTLALGAHPHHLPGESDPLEGTDEEAPEVELAAAKAVERRRGERVVVVVPGLPEGSHR